MERAICFLSLFISTAGLSAMEHCDAMEIDNGSPRELSQEHVKSVAFRAINIASPITKGQSIDSENNARSAALAANQSESLPELGSCSTPNRDVDKIDLDLGELAIDADAMDDN